MIKISNSTQNVESIKIFPRPSTTDSDSYSIIDSVLIIPGVTNYNNIYSIGCLLYIESNNSYIVVEFNNNSNLERFFIQLLRDMKINNTSNIIN